MALIRSLPADYDAFVSTVVLLPDFGYEKVKEAFYLEEQNRRARKLDTASLALANAASTTASASAAAASIAPSSDPAKHCDFCQGTGHEMRDCFKF